MKLRIDEQIGLDGTSVETTLEVVDGAMDLVHLRVGSQMEADLPAHVLDAVLERYGKPLADGIPVDGDRLVLGGDRVVTLLRHRGYYDVIARDFVVLERPGREPLAELATSVAAALRHLGTARSTG